jgi:hypothetical protein
MLLDSIKEAFEAAEKFDRENVATDPARVIGIYDETVIKIYEGLLPGSEYVKKARARIEQIRGTPDSPPANGNADTTPAPAAAEGEDAADEGTTPGGQGNDGED